MTLPPPPASVVSTSLPWLTALMILTFWTLRSGLDDWQGEEAAHWPLASLVVHGPPAPQCLTVPQILGEEWKIQGEILVLF